MPVRTGWENGRRVHHRISGRHVGLQLLRTRTACRNGRDRRRPGPAGHGSASPDSRREPAHPRRRFVDPRTHRPHLVGAKSRRHLRLPGLHPPRGPLHADRPDQGVRSAARPDRVRRPVPRTKAGGGTRPRRGQDRHRRQRGDHRSHAGAHARFCGVPGRGGCAAGRLHRGHAFPAVGRPHRPSRGQRPRPTWVDHDKTDGARRRHRGTTWARREVHHRLRAPRQPLPRRSDFVNQFQAPKGVPDYLPPESAQFVAVRDGLLAAARRAGYADAELPIFEDTALFARGVGESTDVVSKEMYTFADRGDRSVTLRPEGTAGVIRAVIEHGLDRGALPVKLCYSGPFFRYERPQAGRYRQLQQVGVEAIGVDDPALDAEVIAVADEGFRALGLTGYRLELTSLGDADCRPAYGTLLRDFLAGLDLDEDTRRRAEINPLRVLDDKRPHVKEMTADAPVMLDHLSDSAKQHFDSVLAHLDAAGVPYVINPRMVRGLDYYTKTTFEFVHDGLGAQSGIGGGGRYDGLMSELGGKDLSGIGFGLGVDRTLLALKAEGKSVGDTARVEVFGFPLGEQARVRLSVLATQLRAAGVRVDLAFGDRSMKSAMRAADRSGASIALVAGDRDIEAGTIGVKNLATGEQTDIPVNAVLAEVLSRLSRA